jgi:hypothetical protein
VEALTTGQIISLEEFIQKRKGEIPNRTTQNHSHDRQNNAIEIQHKT